jgi:CRP/FNR family transcriptional regulator, cyclic AMP receptor protein
MPERTPGAPQSRLPEWSRKARGHGLLSGLPDDVVSEVLVRGHRVEYPKGTIGLRWDEAPKTAIILCGSARAYLAYPDGSQATTRYLEPGDMFGVFAAREPRIARGVQALEHSELLLIDSDRMKELAAAFPEFAWALIEELTTILNTTHRALYIRAFGAVRQRVAVTILDRARLLGPLAPGAGITGTQSELATAAGTVREVVATVLQAMKREGLVDVRRGMVVIRDPDRLGREADGGFDLMPPEQNRPTDQAL